MKLKTPELSQIDQLPDLIRFLSIYLKQVDDLAANGISFSDNFDQKTLSVTFNVTNTELQVSHGLGRVPVGYLVTGLSAPMIVYNSGRNFSADSLYLKSSAAGIATLIVF